MTRRIPVQIYFAPDHVALIRQAASSDGIAMSSWVRRAALKAVTLEQGDRSDRAERDLTFAILALDGLLASNADGDLRDRVHLAFARKLDERGLRRPVDRGGE